MADTSIRSLLQQAADERITAVIEIHSASEALVYLVEGEVYLADLRDAERLQDRLARAGLLTAEQIERHTEPGDEEVYLALALDTDETIDEAAIAEWLLDLTARTIHGLEANLQGEYEVDPYGSHPVGILASWPVDVLYERIAGIEATPEPPPAESPGTASGPAGHDPSPEDLPPPPPTGPTALAAADTVPVGLERVELSPAEWRVVVATAKGVARTELAGHLSMDGATADELVGDLLRRGLLTTG